MKNKRTALHPYCRLGCALILFAGIAPLPSLAAGTVAKAGAEGHRLLLVGPERTLKLPSAAAKIARPGDRIMIDAGVYRDCAVWRTANITIEGVGGYAHVKDVTCHRKAIWVFYASPVRISNVRFSGARVQHRNGAGIRWEGSGRLTLRNTWFHNNQMGILTHNRHQSEMAISDSRFEQNGDCPTFCGHGVYAGRIAYLSITNSQFAGQKFGHHIKSRALVSNIIANRLLDGATGTASYAINLPDSGTATIRNNYIEKGPLSDNVKAVIAIGEEGAHSRGGRFNPSRGIVIEKNVFQNNNRRKTNFVWNRGYDPVTLRGNKFGGPGVRYRGFGQNRANPVNSTAAP
jgi:hypothetical protein